MKSSMKETSEPPSVIQLLTVIWMILQLNLGHLGSGTNERLGEGPVAERGR